MPQNNTCNDLCMTCIHAPTCVRKSVDGRSIWFCEEFDDYVPKRAKILPNDASVARDEEITDSVKYAGLCVNCENRKACAHTKVEGGVWHCEDYN